MFSLTKKQTNVRTLTSDLQCRPEFASKQLWGSWQVFFQQSFIKFPLFGTYRCVFLKLFIGVNSLSALEDIVRIPKTTLSPIIPQVSAAIYNVLQLEFLSMPQTPDDWARKAMEFDELWQYEKCLGALDGKHIQVQCFPNTGSVYYNYKGKCKIPLVWQYPNPSELKLYCQSHIEFANKIDGTFQF